MGPWRRRIPHCVPATVTSRCFRREALRCWEVRCEWEQWVPSEAFFPLQTVRERSLGPPARAFPRLADYLCETHVALCLSLLPCFL